MTVYGEVTYVFHMPQDYDEMKQFEAENDLSIYRRTEDTIAVRYKHKVNATYPYKSKADRKTEPQRDDIGNCNICKYVGLEHRCNQCVNGSMFCKVEDEPQTDCLTCRYNSDEWDSPKCDGCSKAYSNYEPQTERSE